MSDFISSLLFIFIIAILFSYGCSKKGKFSDLSMPETQYKALNQRLNKSVNIKKSIENSDYSYLKQTNKIIDLKSEMVNISSLSFTLPSAIKVPKLIETDHYWIVYNVILSPTDSNIVKFDKQGKFINMFARKGRGPDEVTKIDALGEKNYIVYVSDNGSLKKFNKENKLKDQKFLKIWAHDISLHTHNYDLRSAANKVFSFPVYTLDITTDTIQNAIKDDRKDVFNYKSGNNTTFFSNDTLIIYAKTPTNKLHFFSKSKNMFTQHFQIKADFIRKNKDILPKRPSKFEFMHFYNSLFLINKIYLFNNTLYITFADRNNGKNTYYLAKALLSEKSEQNTIPLKIYQTNNVFKTAYFYRDHLYYYSPSQNGSMLSVHTIKLNEL